ncbi:MAG: hypothetical protein KAS32_10050 [Candidatus Peribacteraceae bacterium]|nr:hypothetical protein [Candidatus Peribacteraceae bacterium]
MDKIAVLHSLVIVETPPYFQKMRVESGWLYNFWDVLTDNYSPQWIFVPDALHKCGEED